MSVFDQFNERGKLREVEARGSKQDVFERVENLFDIEGLIHYRPDKKRSKYTSVYDFNVVDLLGFNTCLDEYKGKVLLITNTGRKDKHAA